MDPTAYSRPAAAALYPGGADEAEIRAALQLKGSADALFAARPRSESSGELAAWNMAAQNMIAVGRGFLERNQGAFEAAHPEEYTLVSRTVDDLARGLFERPSSETRAAVYGAAEGLKEGAKNVAAVGGSLAAAAGSALRDATVLVVGIILLVLLARKG